MAKTLYEKIWDAHVVRELRHGSTLLYIDRHLLHEVTSPIGFDSLRAKGRKVRQPALTLAVVDHNIPTSDRTLPILDQNSAEQIAAIERNTAEFGVSFFGGQDRRQGIVHVVGPEQGFVLPGMTVVCGDSHTSTNGAFGALAHGIGSSEVEHVLATQTLVQSKARNIRMDVSGALGPGVGAKDLALAMVEAIGAAGGVGHVVEFAGSTIRAMTMEARMTLCNMTIEAGAKAGLIAPDQTTFNYLKGRPMAPRGTDWDAAIEAWSELGTDPDAQFQKYFSIDATNIAPLVTWGTSPEDVVPVTGVVPSADDFADSRKRDAVIRSLEYMGLRSGTAITDVEITRVFIGSCTNSRIEDLRQAADILRGHKIHPQVEAMVVPGSGLVKHQAEQEGLHRVFMDSGFDWREPGCSMCNAMNPDQLEPGERCASTSNRNFEGRQGRGARTHLVSPAMAAAAALVGRFADVRTFDRKT